MDILPNEIIFNVIVLTGVGYLFQFLLISKQFYQLVKYFTKNKIPININVITNHGIKYFDFYFKKLYMASDKLNWIHEKLILDNKYEILKYYIDNLYFYNFDSKKSLLNNLINYCETEIDFNIYFLCKDTEFIYTKSRIIEIIKNKKMIDNIYIDYYKCL